MALSKILPVPYLIQPTDVTCQSTVLKMMAMYLEQFVVQASTPGAHRAIGDIWKDINKDPKRPKKVLNAHANMKWWLENQFPTLTFEYLQIGLPWEAIEKIVQFIDGGAPVLVSVSHANVAGHIILVVGYENYRPNASSLDFRLVVHDPYGAFDPALSSKYWGTERYTGGACLIGGGEMGPGRGVRLPITGVSRHRKGDVAAGYYYLLSARK